MGDGDAIRSIMPREPAGGPSPSSPKPPGRPRPALAVVPWLALLGLAVAAARIPILTPDVWWHLATGRAIAAGGIPQTDPFSYTLVGQPWLVHEWLADRIAWAVYSRWGLLGLAVGRGVALACAAAVSYRLARRHAPAVVALPLVALAAFAMQRNWIDRPQLWSYVLLPATVWLLETARLGTRRAVWALPALFVLWVNVHGGFMLGLAIVGVWYAARVAAAPGDAAVRREALLAAGACMLAVLLNPHGFEGAVYPLRYVGAGLRHTIQEERPGLLDSSYAWVHFALAVALVVALAVRWRRIALPHRVTAILLILVSWPRLAGVALPFAAERHAPLFLLAGVPILGWVIAAALPARSEPLLPGLARAARTRQAWAVALVLAAFAVWQAARFVPRDGTPAARLLPGRFPVAGAAWLQQQRLPPRLLNPYRWGGFLLFRLFPAAQVWIDSRGDLYGAARLAEEELLYRLPAGAEPAAEQLLQRWDPDVIAWYCLTIDFGRLQLHPFTRWLLTRPEWRLVFVDGPDPRTPQIPAGTTAIFLRVHPRNQAWLDRLPAVPLPPGLPR